MIYSVFEDEQDFFYLTQNDGTLLDCKSGSTDFYIACNSILTTFVKILRIMKKEKTNFYTKPRRGVYLGYGDYTMALFPSNDMAKFLPEEIFASEERVRECIKNILS